MAEYVGVLDLFEHVLAAHHSIHPRAWGNDDNTSDMGENKTDPSPHLGKRRKILAWHKEKLRTIPTLGETTALRGRAR